MKKKDKSLGYGNIVATYFVKIYEREGVEREGKESIISKDLSIQGDLMCPNNTIEEYMKDYFHFW